MDAAMMNHAWLIYSNNYPRNRVLSCVDLLSRVSSPLLLGMSKAHPQSSETEKSRLYRRVCTLKGKGEGRYADNRHAENPVHLPTCRHPLPLAATSQALS